MKVKKYTVETIRPDSRPAIWGMTGNGVYPLCYLRKPKWMTEAQFDAVVKSIRINAGTDLLQVTDGETQ